MEQIFYYYFVMGVPLSFLDWQLAYIGGGGRGESSGSSMGMGGERVVGLAI